MSTLTNANAITFPAPSGADWLSGANLAYLMFFDASTSGNLLGYGALSVPTAFLDGAPAPVFPAGSVTWSFTGGASRTTKAFLNSLFGKTSDLGALASAPAHFYAALSSTDPTADGSGATEPSGGAYARVSTAPSDWNTAS